MSNTRYTEYRKKQRGRDFWGVLRMEGWKQNFRTVGEGEGARRKAKRLARQLNEIEGAPAETSDRFLSWHEPGEPLPLDRTVRDFARAKRHTVAVSTAAHYRQFAERPAERLGPIDLRRLQEEDVGRFVRDECADDRGKDPSINACVLLRGSILAALRALDEVGRPHLSRDPLPKLTKIARRTANDAWRPGLDDHPSSDAWTPEEAETLLTLAEAEFLEHYGPCLFQAATGCRIGEALAMRWSAADLDRGEITIRLKVHNNALGQPKTLASNRTIKIPQRLIDFLKSHRQRLTVGSFHPRATQPNTGTTGSTRSTGESCGRGRAFERRSELTHGGTCSSRTPSVRSGGRPQKLLSTSDRASTSSSRDIRT